ncbi:MAG: GMC family oxidoreductase [Bacteroidota bacterium]
MSNTHTFDAIVVGSGISGGWAAKELCEKGLKTIVLERGRDVKHVADYPTTMKDPWELEHGNRVTAEDRKNSPIQSSIYAFTQASKHFFVNDLENPYTNPEDQPFLWLRGYHVGGRSLIWGRQSYRLSPMDFEANAKDGMAPAWPISYDDIAPWYDYVESFAGISGQNEGLPQLPDGQFLPPMEMNCVEKHVKGAIAENFDDRMMTIGRTANLTVPHKGRGNCQYRNRCRRGCPYGGYFSSNASTLPAAQATGNLTLRPHSIVHSIIFDEETQKAKGVRIIDGETNKTVEYFAKVVFLCASALGSTQILLNSTSASFPDGLGNRGALGRYLMDHNFRVGARAEFPEFNDKHYYGRRPNGIYVPRFRNIKEQRSDYVRGFGYQGAARRTGWTRGKSTPGFGAEWKDSLTEPGSWYMSFTGFGECLPYKENKVELNHDVVDKWGLPTLFIQAKFRENELVMRKDMANSAAEMLEAAGGKNVKTYDSNSVPGEGIHEMGTARMGHDPETSVLNKWNQIHGVPNVFVTDGAAMASSACQNPSLTYMALTARAVDYAVGEMKRLNM